MSGIFCYISYGSLYIFVVYITVSVVIYKLILLTFLWLDAGWFSYHFTNILWSSFWYNIPSSVYVRIPSVPDIRMIDLAVVATCLNATAGDMHHKHIWVSYMACRLSIVYVLRLYCSYLNFRCFGSVIVRMGQQSRCMYH